MKTSSIMHRSILALMTVGMVVAVSSANGDVLKVSSIKLEKAPNEVKFLVESSGNASYQAFKMNNPPRVVLDIIGARHNLAKSQYNGDGRLVKAVRTSQYRNDPDEVTRIVFDLASGNVVTHEEVPVQDDMDFLGGIGRSFKILAE